MSQPPAIWILDSSAIISVKALLPPSRWQEVFNALTSLLDQGLIAYPKKVVEELERYAFQDLPFEWANANFHKIAIPNPPEPTLTHVMAEAGDVVDPNKEQEDGDPYVLGQAVYLHSLGFEVTVVTNDWEDKPTHISMRTACQRLGLAYLRMKRFLENQGIWP